MTVARNGHSVAGSSAPDFRVVLIASSNVSGGRILLQSVFSLVLEISLRNTTVI